MASRAYQDDSLGARNVSGVDGGSGGGGVGDGEANQVAAAAVKQTGSGVPSNVVYNCRICRRAVFNAADIQSHKVAQHNFHRRKVRADDTDTRHLDT